MFLSLQSILKSSPGGARNPFKKQKEATKNVQSPLSLTERTLVEVHSTHEHAENEDVSHIYITVSFMCSFNIVNVNFLIIFYIRC